MTELTKGAIYMRRYRAARAAAAVRPVSSMGKPLEVLYSSPTVGRDIRWIVCVGPNGNYTVRKVKDDIQTVEQTGIRTMARAKQICEDKVTMFRAWSGRK